MKLTHTDLLVSFHTYCDCLNNYYLRTKFLCRQHLSWTLGDELHTVASNRNVFNKHPPWRQALIGATTGHAHELHASRLGITAHATIGCTAGWRITWSAGAFNLVNKLWNKEIVGVEIASRVEP